MSTWTIYGPGGYCESCNETHDHPLNNIIQEIIEEEPVVDQPVINEEPVI
jgi:hypothetical protein